MNKNYSANDELKNLAQNLGFKIYLFDDPNEFGSEIKLREKNKKGEIDAVLIKDNVIILTGINRGSGDKVITEIDRYFEKLDNINKVVDLQLEIEVTKKPKKNIEEKQKLANEKIKEIQEHISNFSQTYNIILKKMFFVPNKQIEEEYIRSHKSKGNIVIDKDIYQYFLEILNRLNKRVLFSDFMYFLGIRKSDLEKTGPSKTFKPAKSRPYKVTRVPLEGDKMIMYSLSIRVEDIINYVTVLRMAQKYDKKGFQRMIKSNRLDKINKEYLEKNETFPNNIILFLNPELYQNEEDFYTPAKDSPYKKDNPGNGELTFFDEYNSLIIIDGQHRFFSFVTGNKTERPILVTLIFLKGEDEAEKFVQMEKMFYKINKTQERVDPNLSFILKARIDPESEENFWYEVFRKLDTKGFFSKRFSFKETTMKKDDQKKSIISVITYGGILRLNKTFKKKGIEVDGLSTFYGTDRIKNIEFSFNLLNNYFDIIEKVLHEQNIKKENLTPREIGALLRLMRHFMLNDKNKLEKLGRVRDIRKEQDKESKDTVEYFEGILKCIPFSEVLELNYPTSNWAAIEGYMLKKIHAKKPKFGNKVLLSKKGLEVYIHETKQN